MATSMAEHSLPLSELYGNAWERTIPQPVAGYRPEAGGSL